MIDPFDEVSDEVETKKAPKVISIKSLYEGLSYIFKIILILILLVFIGFLMLVIIEPENGIIIQPFESNEKELSSIFIANHLCFELQDIQESNNKKIGSPGYRFDYGGRIPPIFSGANSIKDSIAEIGSVGVEGTSLSVGKMVLSIKQFIHHNTPMLTGCIQRSRSDLRIIAVLNDPDLPEGGKAWEICKDISKDNYTTEEIMPNMIEDLAYQIVTNLINIDEKNSVNNPQTWQAVKNLTMSKKALYSYNITDNIEDLDRSRDFALKAKESEPGYSGMSILFSILGSSYLELHNYGESERLFHNAIELNSSYAIPWIGLGLSLFYQGNYDESIQAYDQAIKLDPKIADAWFNKGTALYEKAHCENEGYDESIQAYDQAIKLDPKNADAWYNKGIALYETREYNESIQAYEQTIKLNSTYAEAFTNKGASLLALGKYGESIQAFDEAISLNPKNEHAWNDKGFALYEMREYNESIQAYDKAIGLNDYCKEAWYNKGEALKALGRISEAKIAFAKAKELGYTDES